MSEKDDKYFGDFFSSSLVDHNWLNVDPKTYQAVDNLPLLNRDIVPDLEKMWNHSTDPVRFDLQPNKGLATTQVSSVTQTGMEELAQAKVVANVEKFAKEAMMRGFNSSAVARLLNTKFDKSSLEIARPELTKLSQEFGLLGPVYADVDSYPKCYLGEGEDVVEAAKTAKYIKAKETCAGCIYNQSNRCSKYHKELAKEIPYGLELLKHYKDLLSSTGRAFKIAGDNYKAQLRSLILSSSEVKDDPMKHYEKDIKPEPKISTVEALKTIEAQEAEQPVILSSSLAKLRDTLTLKLMAGPVSQELSSRIAAVNNPVLNNLRQEEGLLGRLYVDLNPFDDCVRVASKFVERNCRTAKFITKMSKCNTCVYFDKAAQNCKLMERPLVPEVSYTEKLAKEVIQSRMQEGLPKSLALKLAMEISKRGPKEVVRAALRWEPRKEANPRFVPFKRKEVAEMSAEEKLAQLNTISTEPKVVANGAKVVEFIEQLVKTGMTGTVLAATIKNRFGNEILKATSDYVLPELKKRKLDSAFYTANSEKVVAQNPISDYDLKGVGNLEVPEAPKKANDLDVTFEGLIL